jgi:mannose-6-phosphate isomerase-like protein (cupin superfamily)
MRKAIELDGLELRGNSGGALSGAEVLQGVLALAEAALVRLAKAGPQPKAVLGRLRGRGRGVHFRDLVSVLEREHPIELRSPFEDSHLVAGAAWDASTIVGGNVSGALAKLRWSAGADDLPMHVHEHSDRFIIVQEGRGFFHVSDQDVDRFDGSDVRSIPARERDVFLFTRGVVHTFSTAKEPMTLLSCQLPYLPFDDPRQYRLPRHRWTARDNPEPKPAMVGCDPAWTVLSGMIQG